MKLPQDKINERLAEAGKEAGFDAEDFRALMGRLRE